MARFRGRSPWQWLVLVAALAVGGWQLQQSGVTLPSAAPQSTTAQASPPATTQTNPPAASGKPTLPGFLPVEAHRTIALIQRGGPFPHRQDGSIFGNRERLLPSKPHGWYREYTVETPGLHHRGARRIVTGGNPPRSWYYTSDHYASFRSFEVSEVTP